MCICPYCRSNEDIEEVGYVARYTKVETWKRVGNYWMPATYGESSTEEHETYSAEELGDNSLFCNKCASTFNYQEVPEEEDEIEPENEW